MRKIQLERERGSRIKIDADQTLVNDHSKPLTRDHKGIHMTVMRKTCFTWDN